MEINRHSNPKTATLSPIESDIISFQEMAYFQSDYFTQFVMINTPQVDWTTPM